MCIEPIKLNVCREDGCSWRLICSDLQPGWGLFQVPFAGHSRSGCHSPCSSRAGHVWHTKLSIYPKKSTCSIALLCPDWPWVPAASESCDSPVVQETAQSPSTKAEHANSLLVPALLLRESFTPSYRETGITMVNEVLGRQFRKKKKNSSTKTPMLILQLFF